MRHKLALIADGPVRPARRSRPLIGLQEDAVERVAKAPTLTPMEATDARTSRRLARGPRHRGGWDLAPTFVQAGLDVAWLDQVAGDRRPSGPSKARSAG